MQFKDAAAAARESRLLQCWPGKLHASQAAVEQALAAETWGLFQSLAKLSAPAGAQAAQLEGLSGDAQRMQQLGSQPAECHGAAAAKSHGMREQGDVQVMADTAVSSLTGNATVRGLAAGAIT